MIDIADAMDMTVFKHIVGNTSSFLRTLIQSLGIGMIAAGLLVAGAGCDSSGDSGGDTTAPRAPVLNGKPAEGMVELSWPGGNIASEYNVYRSTSSTDGASGDPLATTSETSYTDSDVENGTTYYYRITAVGEEGNESSPSSEIEVTPFAAPSSLKAESGDEQIGLNWSPGAGAAEYHVYRSKSSTDGVSDPPLEIVSDTTFTDESVKNGEKYYYRVTSVRGGSESSPTDEVAKRPFDDPPGNP